MESKKYLYDYVKSEINNMAYIQQFVPLKKTGLVFKGKCPFHTEKTASFTVYPTGYTTKKGVQNYTSFYCFGCGVAGDIIKFKQLKDSIDSYSEAALQLAEEYGLNVVDEQDVKINYLKNKLSLGNDEKLLSFEDINLTCSMIIHNYLKHNPNNMNKVNDIFAYLDNELNERNTIEAQSLIQEINDKINNL
jgi:DNA primase